LRKAARAARSSLREGDVRELGSLDELGQRGELPVEVLEEVPPPERGVFAFIG